ncbi:MAG: hypothetical protein M1831_006953 [Alyxoria varia]|nr:MAG: hypothetical protein M1831_006953 [Alyxoria varia]
MSDQMAPPPPPAKGPFDPYTQDITVLASDKTPMPINVQDIDFYVMYGIRICINYASQIGASFTLLGVLLLITRKEKRTSPVFILNVFALALNGIRNVFLCMYFAGPFWEFYNFVSGDLSTVPQVQTNVSIASTVLTLGVLCCIEASLVIQVNAVCVTMRDKFKRLLLLASALVALTAVGFRFGLMVTNSRAIAQLLPFDDYQWLAATNNYITTGSICFFSVIFVAKLAVALNERRKMHMNQFGPMQIIFIMGCQTLLIPAIFSILQNFTEVPELGTQVLTVTAIFLPLSSMWAAASMDNRTSGDNNPNPSRGPGGGHNGGTLNNGNGSNFGTEKPSATSRLAAAIHNRFPGLAGIRDSLVSSSGNNKLLSSILSSQSSRGAPGKMSMSDDTKKGFSPFGSPMTDKGGFGGGAGVGSGNYGGAIGASGGGSVGGFNGAEDGNKSKFNRYSDSEGTTTTTTDDSKFATGTRYKASPGPPPQIKSVDEEEANTGLRGLEEEMRAHMRGREF